MNYSNPAEGSMSNLMVLVQIRLDCYQVPNLINMISITKCTFPSKQVKCDKCGKVIDGGKEELRKHKKEYHSY